MKVAFKFLRRICPDYLYEEIEGDLIQKFDRDVKTFGEMKAKRRLMWNTLRFCRPGIILRNKFSPNLNVMSLFQNYIKTSYRHAMKHRVNFIFKLSGLTLAFISLIIIVIYVSYQSSFDRYHTAYENIYRINSLRDENGILKPYSTVPLALGPAMKSSLPEVREYTRLGSGHSVRIKYKGRLSEHAGFVDADSSIFDVLSFRFIRGDKRALKLPGSIVLTQSLAQQIFGNEDPINRVLTLASERNRNFEVTAVVEDVPKNSHLIISAITNFTAIQEVNPSKSNPWEVSWDNSVRLYVRLAENTNPKALENKVRPLLKANLPRDDDGRENKFSIFLQPITDVYLGERMEMDFIGMRHGSALYVYLFSLLGVFLIVIASINYVNLSIADFEGRTKEMSVRKILGARSLQIGLSVTSETIFFCLFAIIISGGLLNLFFPEIAHYLDPNLQFKMLWSGEVVLILLLILMTLIFLSSAYPSYRLRTQNPVHDLKKVSGIGRSTKALLLIQFVISTICICATIIVGKQVNFFKDKDIGYDRNNLIQLIMPDQYAPEIVPVLKNEIRKLSVVKSASYSYYSIVGPYLKDSYKVEINGKMTSVLLNETFVDYEYLQTMSIPLKEGRNFDINNRSDQNSAFIVNESAVKEFGWKEPLGKRIKLNDANDSITEGTVVGVVKDFNTLSLHSKIEPQVLRLQYDSWPGFYLNVRITGTLDQTLPIIKSTFEKLMPGFLLEYRLVKDSYENQYKEEAKALSALQFGTIIILLMSSLGIFSISIYMSIKRMKEFGIRKVLGATVGQIAALQTRYFLTIAIIANVIALPIAYLLMKEWLNGFAYRTELSGSYFLLVMLITSLLVILSAGYSAWKAGRMNPVDVIKME